MLSVTGERKEEKEERKGESFRSERYFGRFHRTVTLPTQVNGDKVKATYKDGILTVELPKSEEAKPKQIQVNVS
jgi:HSP20 family protein